MAWREDQIEKDIGYLEQSIPNGRVEFVDGGMVLKNFISSFS
jgi:hypothetical protein